MIIIIIFFSIKIFKSIFLFFKNYQILVFEKLSNTSYFYLKFYFFNSMLVILNNYGSFFEKNIFMFFIYFLILFLTQLNVRYFYIAILLYKIKKIKNISFFYFMIKSIIQKILMPISMYVYLVLSLFFIYDYIIHNKLPIFLLSIYFWYNLILFFFNIEMIFLRFLVLPQIVIEYEDYFKCYQLNFYGKQKVYKYLKYLLLDFSKNEFIILDLKKKIIPKFDDIIILNLDIDFDIKYIIPK